MWISKAEYDEAGHPLCTENALKIKKCGYPKLNTMKLDIHCALKMH